MKKAIILAILLCFIAIPCIADTVMIQIRFKVQTDYGEYNDALYYTQAEYVTLKQEDIDKEKQKRVDNWIDIVTHPPIYVEPTQEEWRAYYAEKKEEVDQVEENIVYTKKELEEQLSQKEQEVKDLKQEIDK